MSAWDLSQTLARLNESDAFARVIRDRLIWLLERAPGTLDGNQRQIREMLMRITTANYLCTYGITTMGEPSLRVGRDDRLQRLLEGRVERLAGAGLGLAQGGFEHGPALLDRIEVRRVRMKERTRSERADFDRNAARVHEGW